MRDAIGGSANIFFVAVFLIIVTGYLSFSVTYNRSFRVKNKLINLLEIHKTYGAAKNDINGYLSSVGFNAGGQFKDPCAKYPGSYYMCGSGYCIFWFDQSDRDIVKGYYKVVTGTRVNIPIINRIVPDLRVFSVSGDTITIYGVNGAQDLTRCP